MTLKQKYFFLLEKQALGWPKTNIFSSPLTLSTPAICGFLPNEGFSLTSKHSLKVELAWFLNQKLN